MLKNTEILMILYYKRQCCNVSVSSSYVATGDNLILLSEIFFKVFNSRRMRGLGQVAHMEMRNSDEVTVDKCEGKNLLRRPGHK